MELGSVTLKINNQHIHWVGPGVPGRVRRHHDHDFGPAPLKRIGFRTLCGPSFVFRVQINTQHTTVRYRDGDLKENWFLLFSN